MQLGTNLSKCQKSKWTQSSDLVGGVPTLLSSLPESHSSFCLHATGRQMPGDTCLPLDVWP